MANPMARLRRAIIPQRVEDDFDERYGVDTATEVPRWRLMLSGRFSRTAISGTRYQTADAAEVARALRSIESPEWFNFVDLGCGKGRILIIAAQFGFTRLIGVEYNSALAETARQNLLTTETKAIVINQDAARFKFPPTDTIVFMHNPFVGSVMQSVIDNMANHNGRLRVIYGFALCAEMLNRNAAFRALGPLKTAPAFLVWEKN